MVYHGQVKHVNFGSTLNLSVDFKPVFTKVVSKFESVIIVKIMTLFSK